MREPSTFEQALTYTGMTLPSNFDSFPADVQAYYKLRIITSAFNDDNGTDKLTAEKAVGYPCIDDNGICSEEHVNALFPYWNFELTRSYCGSRIGVKYDHERKWDYVINCGLQFAYLWRTLSTKNISDFALPSNINDFPSDVQAYIKLRLFCRSLNGGNVCGNGYFPVFSLSSGPAEDIVGIRKYSGGEAAYQSRIRTAQARLFTTTQNDKSLINLSLIDVNLAKNSGSRIRTTLVATCGGGCMTISNVFLLNILE